MMQSDPRDWSVLKNGSATQRKAFEILSSTKLFDELRSFDPAHVGTIGNDIDIPGSDIDIICSCSDFDALESALQRTWASRFVVQCRRTLSRRVPALVATISSEIPIEIYAEATPIEQQLGFRHYRIACRVLKLFGDAARSEIRKMKAAGLKTEPAFARYLGLSGDPYLALLGIEQMTDPQVAALSPLLHGTSITNRS